MKKFTCIARCRVCGKELNRAVGVPESDKTTVAICAPFAAMCEEKSHNTFSDLNLRFDLEWIEEAA